MGLYLLVLSIFTLSSCLRAMQMISESDSISVKLVGCFDENYEYQEFPFNLTDSVHSLTADACIRICLKQYFRFVFCVENNKLWRWNILFTSSQPRVWTSMSQTLVCFLCVYLLYFKTLNFRFLCWVVLKNAQNTIFCIVFKHKTWYN